VLDAACGVIHPLKFYLSERVKELRTNDIDERILSEASILAEIDRGCGPDAAAKMKPGFMTKLNPVVGSVTELPYPNSYFDKIFCISVLEHLPDSFNKHSWLPFWAAYLPLVKKDMFTTLKEFGRVLKPGGLIVLTFDFPSIRLSYLDHVVRSVGLKYADGVHFDIPPDALFWKEANLHFFRAVLTK
jgi:SAM-dependent methyltransferase